MRSAARTGSPAARSPGWPSTLGRTPAVQAELSLRSLYEGQTDYLEPCAYLRGHGFVLGHVLPGFTDPESAALLQIDDLFQRPDSPGA